MLQTYQTRIRNTQPNNSSIQASYLEEYGTLFGILERKLFTQSYVKGVSVSSIKKAF